MQQVFFFARLPPLPLCGRGGFALPFRLRALFQLNLFLPAFPADFTANLLLTRELLIDRRSTGGYMIADLSLTSLCLIGFVTASPSPPPAENSGTFLPKFGRV